MRVRVGRAGYPLARQAAHRAPDGPEAKHVVEDGNGEERHTAKKQERWRGGSGATPTPAFEQDWAHEHQNASHDPAESRHVAHGRRVFSWAREKHPQVCLPGHIQKVGADPLIDRDPNMKKKIGESAAGLPMVGWRSAVWVAELVRTCARAMMARHRI